MNAEASPLPDSWLRAVVHIGPMKTGTTALAISLAASTRSGRLAPDLVYPIDELWASEGNPVAKHHSITSLARAGSAPPEIQRTLDERRDGAVRRLDNLSRVLRSRGDGQCSVFFIAEGATYRVDPVELTDQLLTWFDEVTYCLVARGQVPGIESSLSHAVRKSVPRDVNSASRPVNIKAVHERRFDYSRIVSRWSSLARARLIVVPFLEGDIATYALFDRLFTEIGLPLAPREEVVDGRRVHSAISVGAERKLRLLAAFHRHLSWNPALQRIVGTRFARVRARALRRSRHHGAADRRTRLSARKAEAVRSDYAQSNAEFKAFLGDAALEPPWVEWFAAQQPAH